jgi:glycosyltransferase involved in cell wall biosynthesis
VTNKPTNPVAKSLWILRREGPGSFVRATARAVRRQRNKPSKHVDTQLVERLGYLNNPVFQINNEMIEKSKAINAKKVKGGVKSALWFVPYFDHVTYGGIFTIFRFIEGFAKRGAKTTIVIFDNQFVDKDAMQAEISEHFPGLKDIDIIIFKPQDDRIEDLPASDISFATIWMSAYFLLRYNQTKHKYYFVQDYEPLFYEGGSMYAAAESTYRFGFTGVVNTPGLLYAINQRHGMDGVSFVPAINPNIYHPPTEKRTNKRTKIFFYARPGNPRNAFELCILIIKQLIAQYGDKIEIVTAGAVWDESDFGLGGKVTNLGLLKSLEEVADLYRTCDIGCVYMLSKHPSYQPFEFMASGMATVSNTNEDNLWFLQHGYNCLLSEPSPVAMAEKIGWLVDDPVLREKLAKNGKKIVSTDWEKNVDEIWNYIASN